MYGTTPVTPHYTYYTYFSIVEQALVFFLDSVVPFFNTHDSNYETITVKNVKLT